MGVYYTIRWSVVHASIFRHDYNSSYDRYILILPYNFLLLCLITVVWYYGKVYTVLQFAAFFYEGCVTVIYKITRYVGRLIWYMQGTNAPTRIEFNYKRRMLTTRNYIHVHAGICCSICLCFVYCSTLLLSRKGVYIYTSRITVRMLSGYFLLLAGVIRNNLVRHCRWYVHLSEKKRVPWIVMQQNINNSPVRQALYYIFYDTNEIHMITLYKICTSTTRTLRIKKVNI